MAQKKLKSIGNLYRWLLASFIIYLILYVYYYIIKGNDQMGDWVEITQLFISVEYVVLFFILAKIKPQAASIVIFILVLLNTIIIRGQFLDNHLTAFGPDPIDAYHYLDDAKRTAGLSLEQTFKYFSDQTEINYEFHVDDYGMSLIARLAYVIGGGEQGYLFVMLVFNAIAVGLSTNVFCKLLELLFEKEITRVGVVFFGLFTGFQMLSVYGLKENFFLLFTLLALLYSLRYLIRPSSKFLLLAFLFILSLCLFRFAVSAQVLLALVCTIVLKRSKHRGFVFFLFFVGSIVALVSLNVIIILLGGSGLENMLIMAELRNTSSTGSMVVEYISQFIFSFIGQPALYMGEFNFNHIALFSCLLRNFTAVLFVFGLIKTLKAFEERYWFLLIYWILGSFMLIMAIRSSDFRYSCLYFPAFIALALKGWNERNSVPLKSIIAMGVLGIVFLFILGWNK